MSVNKRPTESQWLPILCYGMFMLLFLAGESHAQDQAAPRPQLSSSNGKEFYTGFMKNLDGHSVTSLRLTISTTYDTAQVVVESQTGVIHQQTVSNSFPSSILISNGFQVATSDFSDRRKGLHIYTMNDATISVIAENFIFPHNHGVFLAYPCLTFDTENEYEYILTSTDVTSTPKSQVLLVGCENDTKISIIPSQSISLPQDFQLTNSPSMVSNAGSIVNGSLHQMQTLLISSDHDLTGTKVVSNKPLTVIAGHECAVVFPNIGGCEPFAIQIPPTITWGTTFLLSPFNSRDPGSIFKLSIFEETSILLSCGNSSLYSGSIFANSISFITNDFCFLHTSKPILVVQLATAGTLNGIGEPAITLISPTDQYVNEVSFVTLPEDVFSTNFIGVTVRAEHFDESRIILNGEKLDCLWNPIYNSSYAVFGYGCSKNISSWRNTPRQHVLSHSDNDGLISVVVYGFNSLSGYAYLGGQHISIGNENSSDGVFVNVDFLPYFDINQFDGVISLERVEDAVSSPINIPNGVLFGSEIVFQAYVSENGVISLDDPWMFSSPERFPTRNVFSREKKVLAAFWSDNDIRREGIVRYAIYCNSEYNAQCTDSSASQAILNEINQFIQNRQDDTDPVPFTGDWMLIAQWDHVHSIPHGAEVIEGIPFEELSKTNTYQAILVKSGLKGYVIFTYQCGDIQWSNLNGRGASAVVGYNAGEEVFFNNEASGFPFVGDIISCSSIFENRLTRRQTNTGGNSFVYGMSSLCGSVLTGASTSCSCLIQSDENAFYSGKHPMTIVEDFSPCPSTRMQATEDARFDFQGDFPLETECYVRQDNYSFFEDLTGRTFQVYQQCCYNRNSGTFIDNIETGYVGTMITTTNNEQVNSPDLNDRMFRNACCGQDHDGVFCSQFFDRRPVTSSTGYEPPNMGNGIGDPHYTTFDGRYYTFNGHGDFTVLEVLPKTGLSDSEVPIFTLQGRLGFVSFWPRVTTHLELAFGDSNAAFHILGTSPQIVRTKPGTPLNITNELGVDQTWKDPSEKVVIRRNRKGTKHKFTANFLQSEITIIVNVNIYTGIHYMNFEVRVPNHYSGQTRGLLGNMDGNIRNDFYRRGETEPLQDSELSDQDLLEPLLSWRVSENSLFSDSARQKRQTPPTGNFTPIFFSQLNITDEHRSICGKNKQCLFDIAASGDATLAMTTLEYETEFNKTVDILSNLPPNISANSRLPVQLYEESILLLIVTDPVDNFTLSVKSGFGNYSLQRISDTDFIFRCTLDDVTNNPLTFVAIDSTGVSSSFTPIVEICACANGGECTLEGVLTSSTTITMRCICPEAFDGPFCEEDRNGCSEIECFEGVECMDVPAPGMGAVCGSCPPGYSGDSLKCYDIDECFVDNSLCGETGDCVNTDGGYLCSCLQGYQPGQGGKICLDIDECSGIHNCQQLCVNTLGSYMCFCLEGFRLDEDNRSCIAKQPCDGLCSYGCAVIGDQEHCFCPTGFQLDVSNGTQCNDIDECTTSDACDQKCTNTEGSFVCSCMTGYKLLTNGRQCEDIDECYEAALESTSLCVSDPNSQCVNREGSFECDCVPGYHLNNNGTCMRMRNEFPPPVIVRLPPIANDINVNFTSTTLTPETFSPGYQQRFREVTAVAVNTYCSSTTCILILSPGEFRITSGLVIAPLNVALPTSLVGRNNEGQLVFTLYIQIDDSFLAKEQLELAIIQFEELYRDAGFLFALSTTTEETNPPAVGSLDRITIILVATILSLLILSAILLVIVICIACYCKKTSQKLDTGPPSYDEVYRSIYDSPLQMAENNRSGQEQTYRCEMTEFGDTEYEKKEVLD